MRKITKELKFAIWSYNFEKNLLKITLNPPHDMNTVSLSLPKHYMYSLKRFTIRVSQILARGQKWQNKLKKAHQKNKELKQEIRDIKKQFRIKIKETKDGRK